MGRNKKQDLKSFLRELEFCIVNKNFEKAISVLSLISIIFPVNDLSQLESKLLLEYLDKLQFVLEKEKEEIKRKITNTEKVKNSYLKL